MTIDPFLAVRRRLAEMTEALTRELKEIIAELLGDLRFGRAPPNPGPASEMMQGSLRQLRATAQTICALATEVGDRDLRAHWEAIEQATERVQLAIAMRDKVRPALEDLERRLDRGAQPTPS